MDLVKTNSGRGDCLPASRGRNLRAALPVLVALLLLSGCSTPTPEVSTPPPPAETPLAPQSTAQPPAPLPAEWKDAMGELGYEVATAADLTPSMIEESLTRAACPEQVLPLFALLPEDVLQTMTQDALEALPREYLVTLDPSLLSTLALTSTSAIQQRESGSVRHLAILYTNDEHGWIAESEESAGAAALAGQWHEQEGYQGDERFLILSGGDMWTGPAISSWFDGEPTIEVMNEMGYDAAAIGNHEMDFGLDILRERQRQAEFPFLSANILDKATGTTADIALPYVVQTVNEVPVGIVGLTTTSTPETTMPSHVAGFDFITDRVALEATIPEVKAHGAQLIIVLGHICADEMGLLSRAASDLGIAVISGGHCNEQVTRVSQGVSLIQAGSYLEGYVRLDLLFDLETRSVVDAAPQYHCNLGGIPDPEVGRIVAAWQHKVDEALDEVIGYLEAPLSRRSAALHNLVTDAWLAAYPAADVALTNTGGFRQDLPAGEITLADIVGVLPFNNVLVDVELTGDQLIQNIRCCRPVMAGMTTAGGMTLVDGTEIDPQATYHVLVNDFMYAGGDNYDLANLDGSNGYNTAIDWRSPVIEWIDALGTSPGDPLDDHLDPTPR